MKNKQHFEKNCVCGFFWKSVTFDSEPGSSCASIWSFLKQKPIAKFDFSGKQSYWGLCVTL